MRTVTWVITRTDAAVGQRLSWCAAGGPTKPQSLDASDCGLVGPPAAHQDKRWPTAASVRVITHVTVRIHRFPFQDSGGCGTPSAPLRAAGPPWRRWVIVPPILIRCRAL